MLSLLTGGYERDDLANLLDILQNGLESVCGGDCDSCRFDRQCADIMRLEVFISQRLEFDKYKEN